MAPFNPLDASTNDGSMEMLVARFWGDNDVLWLRDKDMFLTLCAGRNISHRSSAAKHFFWRESVLKPHLASFADPVIHPGQQ